MTTALLHTESRNALKSKLASSTMQLMQRFTIEMVGQTDVVLNSSRVVQSKRLLAVFTLKGEPCLQSILHHYTLVVLLGICICIHTKGDHDLGGPAVTASSATAAIVQLKACTVPGAISGFWCYAFVPCTCKLSKHVHAVCNRAFVCCLSSQPTPAFGKVMHWLGSCVLLLPKTLPNPL